MSGQMSGRLLVMYRHSVAEIRSAMLRRRSGSAKVPGSLNAFAVPQNCVTAGWWGYGGRNNHEARLFGRRAELSPKVPSEGLCCVFRWVVGPLIQEILDGILSRDYLS